MQDPRGAISLGKSEILPFFLFTCLLLDRIPSWYLLWLVPFATTVAPHARELLPETSSDIASPVAMVQTVHALKILCLHGKGGCSSSFRPTLAPLMDALGPAVEWDFLDAILPEAYANKTCKTNSHVTSVFIAILSNGGRLFRSL